MGHTQNVDLTNGEEELHRMSHRSARKRVAVIGAGTAGLSAIKSCLEEDLEPVAFEQWEDVGGAWIFTPTYRKNQGASVFRSACGNQGVETNCYSDFPFPDIGSEVFTHQQFRDYLRSYARHFDLYKHIKFNTRVLEVARTSDHAKTGSWHVRYQSNDEHVCTETFDFVLVCSGFLRTPIYPDISGIDKFKGEALHSIHYKDHNIFLNKNIVVIGNAFSAADIATDAARIGNKVYLAVGRGSTVLPLTTGAGACVSQAILRRFPFILPYSLQPRALAMLFQQQLPNKQAEINFLKRTPPMTMPPLMLSDLLPAMIMRQEILVNGYVTEIREHSVVMDDREEIEDIDMIVFATGYSPDYTFLPEDIRPGPGTDCLGLYKHVWHPNIRMNTLAFSGALYLFGSVPSGYEVQARWAVQVFKGKLQLPSHDAMKQQGIMAKHGEAMVFGKSKSIAFWPAYVDEISTELGTTPPYMRSIFTDPILAYHLLFSPMYPEQFRMVGPHAQKDARQKFLAKCHRYQPLSLRWNFLIGQIWIIISVVIVLLICYTW